MLNNSGNPVCNLVVEDGIIGFALTARVEREVMIFTPCQWRYPKMHAWLGWICLSC